MHKYSKVIVRKKESRRIAWEKSLIEFMTSKHDNNPTENECKCSTGRKNSSLNSSLDELWSEMKWT